MRIAVCAPQVPFERGGTEVLTETLTEELRRRDHEVELVRIPFKWYPGARPLREALLWRLVDLEEAQGRPIEKVIATKFPSYAIRHPNKVVWLVHQFRQAYELDGTELGQFGQDPFGRATVRSIQRLDRTTLGEARRLFAISRNVADRLHRSTGLEAEVLVPPPQQLAYRSSDGVGSFILSVGRLDRAKRIDLLLEAAALDKSLRVVVAGEGPDRQRLEQLSSEHGLDGRVTFAGRVADDELVGLYADCLAVFYAPIDEDLGLVPYEAFLSEKPVVTTRDAGGPLEVVVDRENGLVCEPAPAAVAEAFAWLAANPEQARAWGRSGKQVAERTSWDGVIDRLLGS
jgi:glycosyltransferase involved in cell wall biosynthesis